MLKIVRDQPTSTSVVLRLEGRLVGPWVPELRRIAEEVFAAGLHLGLDCADLAFIDREGVALMRELTARQATLLSSSMFVGEMLRS